MQKQHIGGKIFRKGILLVLIPLFFDIVFVCTLSVLQQQSEEAAARANRVNTVLMGTHDLGTHFTQALYVVFWYVIEKNESFRRIVEDLMNIEVPHDLELVKKNLSADPREQELGRKVELSVQQAINTYKYILTLPDPMKELHRKGIAASTKSKIAESLRNILQANNEIDETLVQESKDLPQVTANLRQRVRVAVYIGVALNVLIAIALASYFSRAITARIAVMFTNTDRFAKHLPLLPEVGGDDELAALDSAFHKSVSEARNLERLRQEFLQMVTHDIRAPVTSVRTFLGNIETGIYGQLPPRLLESGKVAERSLSRVYAMVSDLLDLEKIDSGTMKLEPTSINIRSLCREAIDTISAEADRLGVSLSLDAQEVTTRGDEKRLLQVIVNLLGNAIKVAPAQSTVAVLTQVQDTEVKLSVVDQGPGIPDTDLGSVFERFSQVSTPRAAPGIGLGLAICKSLVELHGGTIQVCNNAEAGACFSFTIPIKSIAQANDLQQSPPAGI